jgi:hypothetical protein
LGYVSLRKTIFIISLFVLGRHPPESAWLYDAVLDSHLLPCLPACPATPRTETIADATPAPVFSNEDNGDVADEWDAEPSAAPAKPKAAAAAEPIKNVPKKTPKQIAKEREAKEAAERHAAAAARDSAARAEMERMRSDPDYARKKKEQEQRDIEASELDLVSDMFGAPSKAKPAAAPALSPEDAAAAAKKAERARELASMSGLGDGADNVGMINDPNADRGLGAAPPSVLDAVPLADKDDAAAFAKILARKLNDGGKSAVSLAVLKETLQAVAAQLKLEDVTELLRVTTVIKNDAQKAQQNKKKKSAKPQIKSGGKGGASQDRQGGGGGDYEDYDDYDYDDGHQRNGPDADFY